MFEADKMFSRAALLFPALHFSTCTIFMSGYSAGFGSNIGGLFSISDFFTITIQFLFTTYVANLLLPFIIIFSRHKSKTHTSQI